jgi:UDP-N-acetyl-D-mannosaminuronic acid transferase (WecB/TagA/CpsF family)
LSPKPRVSDAAPDTCLSPLSYNIFGAKVTPLTLEDAILLRKRHIDARRQCVLASQNLHGLWVRSRSPQFRALHARRDAYIHLDGMSLVILASVGGVPAERRHRVTWVDPVWPLLRRADAAGWRVYYLGGEAKVLEAGLAHRAGAPRSRDCGPQRLFRSWRRTVGDRGYQEL